MNNIYDVLYPFAQLLFELVYVVGSISMAFMLGCIMESFPIKLPQETKFFSGMAMTPFFIGIYMCVIGLIPFRLPNCLYYIPLYILTFLYLFLNKEKLDWIKEKIKPLESFVNSKYWMLVENVLAFLISHIIMQLCDTTQNKISFTIILAVIFGAVQVIIKDKKKGMYYNVVRVNLWLVNYVIIYLIPLIVENNKWSLLFQACSCAMIMFALLIYFLKHVNDSLVNIFKALFVYGAFLAYFTISFTLREHSGFCKNLFTVVIFIMTIVVIASDKSKLIAKREYCRWIVDRIYIFTGIGFFLLIYVIIKQFLSPICGSDAVEYLSNAFEYIKTMRITDVNSFRGQAGGQLLAIIHHPGYVLYLAFALLHGPTKYVGYPFDYAARTAFFLNNIYLIFAICGLVCAIKPHNKKFACGFSVLLVFYYDKLTSFLLNETSRDAYRIIPLIVFVTLLIAINGDRKDNKNYLLVLVCSACIMIGHPINAIQAMIIVFAYLIWITVERKFDKYVVFLGIAGVIGVLLGAIQIFCAYATTGNMTGGLIDIEKILEPTVYFKNFMNGRTAANATWIERMIKILLRGNGALILCVAIAMACFYLIKIVMKRKYGELFFVSLIILVQLFSMCDIVAWSGFSLSQWYSLNSRYTLQLYVFSGIFIGIVFERVLNAYSKNAMILFVLTICLLFPFGQCFRTWNEIYSFGEKQRVAERYNICKEMIDNYFCNYYLYNKGISFFTPRCEKIRAANSLEELDIALKEQNIGGILIHDKLVKEWWHDTVLMSYLNSNKYVEYKEVGNEVTVYKLREAE